jgi:hypothetical protein
MEVRGQDARPWAAVIDVRNSKRARAIARIVRQRHIRAGRADQLAHAPSRPDPDRHFRLRLDAMRGRTDHRDPRGRCHLVPIQPQALAGASPTTSMTHLASQEALNGKAANGLGATGSNGSPAHDSQRDDRFLLVCGFNPSGQCPSGPIPCRTRHVRSCVDLLYRNRKCAVDHQIGTRDAAGHRAREKYNAVCDLRRGPELSGRIDLER